MPRLSIPIEKRDEVVSLYENGLSIDNIAKKHGCSNSGIQTVLKKKGVTKRRFGAGGKVKNELEIIALYKKGLSCIDISKVNNISTGTVSNVLKRRGVFARKHRQYSSLEEVSIIREYQSGLTLLDLADKHETSSSMISKILERNKIPRRDLARICKRHKYNFQCRLGRFFEMKSSYEVAYALYLDQKEIKWDYEPNSFHLGLNKETGRRWSYTPDFYLINEDLFIDVKGYQYPKQTARLDLFGKIFAHVNFKILYESDLKNMGIDLNRRRLSLWRDRKQRISNGPLVGKPANANPVNSVDTLIDGDQKGNTEPSLRDKEGVTTIPLGSRFQEESKRRTPFDGDDIV